ncbi:hypothetical protein J6590_024308, partial [Homalodisca vitripennis]
LYGKSDAPRRATDAPVGGKMCVYTGRRDKAARHEHMVVTKIFPHTLCTGKV